MSMGMFIVLLIMTYIWFKISRWCFRSLEEYERKC